MCAVPLRACCFPSDLRFAASHDVLAGSVFITRWQASLRMLEALKAHTHLHTLAVHVPRLFRTVAIHCFHTVARNDDEWWFNGTAQLDDVWPEDMAFAG